MTRKEQTNKRGLEFSGWIRKHLPDSSTGLCVTNQDWIFWNYKTKRLMLMEEKTRKGEISNWFRLLIKNVLHPALSEYCKKNGIDYRGYHLVVFENTSPDDGKIWLDRKEIDRMELHQLISLV